MTFALSMQTHINELDFDKHLEMTFVEFLEALARVAREGPMKILENPQKPEETPLWRRLEILFSERLLRFCTSEEMQSGFRVPPSIAKTLTPTLAEIGRILSPRV
eukprot:CAMPEP_0115046052 /NCGR_PEP_ID=MMETSP0216-20121206/48529_1 /TAXON_ID=223996 /ORGANISM="Protocruzia adherens, Strain Boccale" /LENGTH=104 /DNA_ID=CAMNT_0002429079 /DNA_START=1 /DNA_END=315 /DNA_ORIENTATION=+